MRADQLVERAAQILRRLDTPRATALADELADAWRRAWTVGLTGSIEDRTRCIDALCGGGFFELLGRAPGCVPLRLRRGSITRYRATLADGSLEVAVLPAPRDGGPELAAPPDGSRPRERLDDGPELAAPPDRSLPRERLDDGDTAGDATARGTARGAARTADEVDGAAGGAPRLDEVSGLPPTRRRAGRLDDRASEPPRPPWWAIWAWIARWIALLFGRRAQPPAALAEPERAPASPRRPTTEEVAVIGDRPIDTRDEFLARLRALASGMTVGRGVRELVLEVAGTPLPDGVDLVERDDAPDLEIAVADNMVRAGGETLGVLARAVEELPALAAQARARRHVERAREQALAEVAAIEERVAQAEIELGNRIARLETLRLRDPDRFVADQLARAAASIMSSTNAVIQHASDHLASELTTLASAWARAVETSEDLKATAERLDGEAPDALARVADDVRRLVAIGLGGAVHDLHPAIVGELRAHGMTDAELREPPERAVPPIDKLRVLTAIKARGLADEIGGARRWLTDLFRSIDTRRTELADLLARKSAELHEQAMDELLDTEPALRAALTSALRANLLDAVQRQRTTLDARLAAEHAAVAAERAALAPRTQLADAVRRDLLALGEHIATREAASALVG